jgi:hypothetical protein
MVCSSSCAKLRLAHREDVLGPVCAAIGQHDHETAGSTEHVDGRVVRTSRSAPAMRDDPEAGEPAGDDARDAVCDHLVESTERAGQWHAGMLASIAELYGALLNGRRASQTT